MTALAVAGETRLVPLMTRETVETETPASRHVGNRRHAASPGFSPSAAAGGRACSES
jgi:hypothetical protein